MNIINGESIYKARQKTILIRTRYYAKNFIEPKDEPVKVRKLSNKKTNTIIKTDK